MANVLVVGANGQLGSACCHVLIARGHTVKGLVRSKVRARNLGMHQVKLVQADLTAQLDMDAVLSGVDTMVLTANSVAPRRGDRPGALADGIHQLVEGSVAHGVRRIVLPSIPVSDLDASVPLAAERRRLEALVADSVTEAVVLRLPPFMEVWLALVGSSIPLRGEPAATLGRPSPFLRKFRAATGDLIERRGLMLVPGAPSHRHAFIAIDDVAKACAEAVVRDDLVGVPREVAGPEILSWREVAGIYAGLLRRPVRIMSTPGAIYGAAARMLRPVADVPARTMALNRYMAGSQTIWSPPGGGAIPPQSMTTVEQFLAHKLSLPADLPTVA